MTETVAKMEDSAITNRHEAPPHPLEAIIDTRSEDDNMGTKPDDYN